MQQVSSMRAPTQERSRRTLERIVRATERLLQHQSFDAIGIEEITRLARCSVGSFYARFPSKDSLLPYLYERYDAELRPRVIARMERTDWKSLTLRQTCDRVAAELVDMYAERRHLLRAVALFARAKPQSIKADLKRRREGLHDVPARLLARFSAEIAQPNPMDAARVGLFIVAAAARDKVLFSEAPHAAVTPLTNERLKQELGHALYAYLTCR